MTAKVDAGVYPMCIVLFHWILSLRVVGAFPLLTSSRTSQKGIRLCRYSRVNDHIMRIKSLLLNLIIGSAIISFLTSLLTEDATNFLEKCIPFVLWRIVFVVGTTIVVILLYSLIEVRDRRKRKRRQTKKEKAICACKSTGPLPDSNGTTPLPDCNSTAPLSLLDFNGTGPPTRLVHLESTLATAPEDIKDIHPRGTLATNPRKEQEHLHPEETKALVPREDGQHSALQENSTSQSTSTRPRDPELDLAIQDMFHCLITEKSVQEFCDPRDFVAITIPDNNCQPATVEAALGFSVTLPVGSKVVYKWFDVGPETTKDQFHTLKLQVMESVREAQEIDKDFTLQLGSFAVLKYTDHGPKWWRLQEHWIPTISKMQRFPWNLLDLLTGRSAKWIIRGFNLQNAQLKFSSVDEKEVLNILRSYKMESGEDVLLCEEPCDLVHNSALLFRKEIYICALHSVEVEEGVIVNLQSNPRRVHNKTYWVSVLQGLIPSQWALVILASLSLHNILTGGINLQGTSIFAHILGKALYKFLIYICSYFILVFVLTFWRLMHGQVQRAVDVVPSPRIITSCEGFNNDRRRMSPLPDDDNNVNIEEKEGEEVTEEKGSWLEEEKQEEEEGSCLEEEKREEEQPGSWSTSKNMVYMSTCRTMAILGLLAVITTIVGAAFSDEDVRRYDDVTVIARQSEAHSFEMSAELTAKVKDKFRSGVRSWSTDTISKQVHPHRLRHRLKDYEREVTFQACQSSTCSQCTTYKKIFTQSFCFGVTGTNCIVIELLGDAHISYYNRNGCNGSTSHWDGNETGAPGTSWIGKVKSEVQVYNVNLPPICQDGLQPDMVCLEPIVVVSEKKTTRSLKRKGSRWTPNP